MINSSLSDNVLRGLRTSLLLAAGVTLAAAALGLLLRSALPGASPPPAPRHDRRSEPPQPAPTEFGSHTRLERGAVGRR